MRSSADFLPQDQEVGMTEQQGWLPWLLSYASPMLKGIGALSVLLGGAWFYRSGFSDELSTFEESTLTHLNPTTRTLLQTASIGVVNSVGDQALQVDEFFEVVFNENIFSFNNATELFYANASLANGDPLPVWMQFKHETPSLLVQTPSGGSNARDIQIQGNYVYLAVTGGGAGTIPGLMIYDISTLTQIQYIGNFTTSKSCYWVTVKGNYAYLSDEGATLHVINITDPSTPVEISSVITSKPKRSQIVGNKLYLASKNVGFKIIDVTNKASPSILSSFNCIGDCYYLQIVGNRAYVTGSGGGEFGLDIMDITDDGNPILIKRFNYGGAAFGIAVQNNLAYIAHAPGGLFPPGMSIIDISDELNPVILSNFTTTNAVSEIVVKGNLAYLSNNADGLRMLDVSNPYVPKQLAIVDLPGPPTERIRVINNRAYTTAVHLGFRIFDLGGWKLTGTPMANDKGVYDISIIATSPGLGQLEDRFQIVVGQLPPQLNKAIPNQLAVVDEFFSFFFDQGTFSDPNKDPILYSSSILGQTGLPSWLSFNEVSGTFSGTPRSGDVGDFTVEVVARDNISGNVKTTFTLTVDNAPAISKLIASQKIRVGKAFNFQIDSNTFIDIDPEDTLTYQVTLQNGQFLPTWLQFDATTLRLSGTPTDLETVPLKVTATDSKGVSTFMLFSIEVQSNHAPEVAIPIESKVVQINQAFQFIIPEETFMDPNDDTLMYQAQESDGNSLPSWLHFEAATRQFSGEASRSATGTYKDGEVSIALSASDGLDEVITHFKIFVQGESHLELAIKIGAPLLSGLIALAGIYKKRAIFLNCWNRKKYRKDPEVVKVGQSFERVMLDSNGKLFTVQAFQRKSKQHCSSIFKCCKSPQMYEPLSGGVQFPWFLEYCNSKNILRTKAGSTPEADDKGSTWLRTIDKAGVIQEEFELIVESDGDSDFESVNNFDESDVVHAMGLATISSEESSESGNKTTRPGVGLFALRRARSSQPSEWQRPVSSRSFRKVKPRSETFLREHQKNEDINQFRTHSALG